MLLLLIIIALSTAAGTTRVEMHNVIFYFDDRLTVHIRYLSGELLPTRPGVPPDFDEPQSFDIAIESGETAISTASLSYLMNTYVFNYPGAPITNIEITTEGNKIKQKGVVHKGLAVPFNMSGTLEPTADGLIRIRATKVQMAKIPVKGLMNLFGIEIDDVINTQKARGVSAEKNTMILDPERLIPAPHMKGKVSAVRIEGDKVIQVFGHGARNLSGKSNYMSFRGGTLQFGKLTMHDADLRLVDSHPRDPFHFFLKRYTEQLVAGYSKIQKDWGLTLSTPDYQRARGGEAGVASKK